MSIHESPLPVAKADTALVQQILQGQYVKALRSEKGKLKGIWLQAEDQNYPIKFPKYLRPLLVRELAPGAFVQVGVYLKKGQWRAADLALLPATEGTALSVPSPALQPAVAPAETAPSSPKLCVQVCRKGKCFKQGSQKILQRLQTEVETNPALQHVEIEAVGCMKACKKGPNLRVLPTGEMLHRLTPNEAIALLSKPPEA